jgi:Holliday junction resolvase
MARRKREDAIDTADLAVQLGLLVLGLTALTIGAIGLGKAFESGANLAGSFAFTAAGVGMLWFAARTLKQKTVEARSRPPFRPAGWTPPSFPFESSGTPFPVFSAQAAQPAAAQNWTPESVLKALGVIDWHQFERFCAAVLRADGFEVSRLGTVQADGSVELIAERGHERVLVHCKHWRTRAVKENTIHGLLASMAEFGATRGMVYALHGTPTPGTRFSEKHGITLVDGGELATHAYVQLTTQQLDEILNPELHHCAHCEAPMALSGGTYRSVWGGSTCPECRAVAGQKDA